MAYIDVAGFVADLKEHAVDHGFHVHDERHFVETYSLRQTWEVDLHPEEACNGPIDLHLALDVDPRVLLSFEDEVGRLDDPDDSPPDVFQFPLIFQWTLPPAPRPPGPAGPGHRAGRRGRRGAAGGGVGHRLVPVGHRRPRAQPPDRRQGRGLAVARVYTGEEPEQLCDTLDRCRAVSLFLLERAPAWLDES